MNSFNYKKKYGQNFLINKDIIKTIIESINPQKEDLIIEIGPGSGALTKSLKSFNSHLIGIEIDRDTKIYLEKLKDEKTTFIYKDFLNMDFDIININKYNKTYFVGNLPYYITTPIIEKIIGIAPESTIVIMVQKEVAERFLAPLSTKRYGYITVLLNYYYNITKVCDVNKENFYPIPNVDSTVIKLVPKQKKESINIQKFKKLLKDSFKYKRKTLKNNLNNYDLKMVENILNNHNYNLNDRAEDIDLETFIDLCNKI